MDRKRRLRLVTFSSDPHPPLLDREVERTSSVLGRSAAAAWRLSITSPPVRPPAAGAKPPAVLDPAALYPADFPFPLWMTSFLVAGELDPRQDGGSVAREVGCDTAAFVWMYDQFKSQRPTASSDLVQIFLARRPSGMSLATFEGRYSGHADVVIPHGPLFNRYLASVATEPGGGWDGFSEQWFATRELARAHGRDLQAGLKPAVVDDARSFVGATQFLLGHLDGTWGGAARFLGLS